MTNTLTRTSDVHNSLADRLAAFFRERPNQWVDGRELARVAGSYAWRTRISDIRRRPHLLTIKNRQRRIKTADGTVIVSKYCLDTPEAA